MITRKEAVDLIKNQLNTEPHEKTCIPDKKDIHKYSIPWHYGRCELRALLDAIYGPPANKDEEL